MKIVETPNIAIISKDESFHAFLKYHFEDCYDLHHIENERDAASKVKAMQPAIIIASNDAGLDFLVESKSISPKSQRILMTDNPSKLDFEKAVNRAEVFRMMSLPFDVDKVSRIFDEATLIYAERIERENETERLRKVSQQLEFQLRQSLIG
jgi:DNA-binding NtrC family response regulator